MEYTYVLVPPRLDQNTRNPFLRLRVLASFKSTVPPHLVLPLLAHRLSRDKANQGMHHLSGQLRAAHAYGPRAHAWPLGHDTLIIKDILCHSQRSYTDHHLPGVQTLHASLPLIGLFMSLLASSSGVRLRTLVNEAGSGLLMPHASAHLFGSLRPRSFAFVKENDEPTVKLIHI
jgi:hypothetical protein